MTQPRQKDGSRFGKIVTAATIILAILLVVVFSVPFFKDWVYLKFFLICGLAFANLGILYLIRC
ncbi:hypothetical protein [Methanoregula sp.]|uniref:hypothetical protein n=1 Tax=Methanoregula sp. TaxID=2052170 RepID=UPI0025E9896C|nr:hypothetical protein [Methanoregula sp.]